jgi:hypothetical protein
LQRIGVVTFPGFHVVSFAASGLFGRQANLGLCLFALLRAAQLDEAAAFDRHRILGGANVRFARQKQPLTARADFAREAGPMGGRDPIGPHAELVWRAALKGSQ